MCLVFQQSSNPAIQQSSGFRDELRNTGVVVQYCKSFIPKLGPEENATVKGIQIRGKEQIRDIILRGVGGVKCFH